MVKPLPPQFPAPKLSEFPGQDFFGLPLPTKETPLVHAEAFVRFPKAKEKMGAVVFASLFHFENGAYQWHWTAPGAADESFRHGGMTGLWIGESEGLRKRYLSGDFLAVASK